MTIQRRVVTGMIVATVAAAGSCFGATLPPPDATGVPAQIIVTVLPGPGGSQPQRLEGGELTVVEAKSPARVIRLERLSGDLANLQLFILLDDSTRSSSLGVHIPELKTFIQSLPPTTQVAVGYMRNGTAAMAQSFTLDHRQAADAVRLPNAIPGENGSPYFALSDVVKHWPTPEPGGRRAILMLTDGVDRYWGTGVMDDPYLDEAVHNALKQGVLVYSIYLRGSGLYGRGAWVRDFAQSRLIQVSEETGGNAYFETFSDPVDIAPFLSDLGSRLQNQYRVRIDARGKGVQPVKVRTEAPGLKVAGPSRVFVP